MNMPDDGFAGKPLLLLEDGSRRQPLEEQLYRYAEDLQQVIERHGELEQRYNMLREASVQLTESRELLDGLIRNSSDMHIVTAVDGSIVQCNEATRRIAPLARFAGSRLGDWVMPSHIEAYEAARSAALNERGASWQEWSERELHLSRVPADQPPLVVSVQAISVGKRNTRGALHWILRDKTVVPASGVEQELGAMAFQNAAEAVMITDAQGEILAINPAFEKITGYRSDEVVGRSPSILKSGVQGEEFYASFWRGLKEKGGWQGKIFNRRKGGEIYPEWLTVTSVRDDNGELTSYIAVFTDMSALIEAERHLAHMAYHDALTGLPNRLLFQDRINQLVRQSKRSGEPFTLIFIDLDNFKPVNDRLGHEVGDQVLIATAKRLAEAMRASDTVSRFGGDEFVVLAPGLAGAADVDRFCRNLIEAVREPIDVRAETARIGASLGCATYPKHGDNPARLVKQADMAMYRAKAAGGNAHCLCDMEPVTVRAGR